MRGSDGIAPSSPVPPWVKPGVPFHKYGNVTHRLCPPLFLLWGYPSSAKLVLGRRLGGRGSVRGSPCGEPARLRTGLTVPPVPPTAGVPQRWGFLGPVTIWRAKKNRAA